MVQKEIDKVLDDKFWPPNLETDKLYAVAHDDTDGDTKPGMLRISFSMDGDAWVMITGPGALRFRMDGGGGKYPKVRNALLLLADAIRQEGYTGQ